MKTPFLPLPCRSFEAYTQSLQLARPVTAGTFLLNDLNLISQFAVQDQSLHFSPSTIPKFFPLFLVLHSRLQPPSGQAKLLNLFLFSVSAVWTNILAAEGSEVIGLCAHERYHGVHAKETGRASCNSTFPSKPTKLWSQEKQRPQPEPREVKKNNSRFFLCQPITLLNPKEQRNNMADCWNLESTRLWHWDREHFSLLFFNYLFPYTLSEGLWFKEWLFSFKIFKLKDQISHEHPSSAFNILRWPWELQTLS